MATNRVVAERTATDRTATDRAELTEVAEDRGVTNNTVAFRTGNSLTVEKRTRPTDLYIS